MHRAAVPPRGAGAGGAAARAGAAPRHALPLPPPPRRTALAPRRALHQPSWGPADAGTAGGGGGADGAGPSLAQRAADATEGADESAATLRRMVQTLVHVQALVRGRRADVPGGAACAVGGGDGGQLAATQSQLCRALAALQRLQAAHAEQAAQVQRLQGRLAAAAAAPCGSAAAAGVPAAALALLAGAGAASSSWQGERAALQERLAAAAASDAALRGRLAASEARLAGLAGELDAAQAQLAAARTAAPAEELGAREAVQGGELPAGGDAQLRWELLSKEAALAALAAQLEDARDTSGKAAAAQAGLVAQKDAAIADLLEKLRLLEAGAAAEASWARDELERSRAAAAALEREVQRLAAQLERAAAAADQGAASAAELARVQPRLAEAQRERTQLLARLECGWRTARRALRARLARARAGRAHSNRGRGSRSGSSSKRGSSESSEDGSTGSARGHGATNISIRIGDVSITSWGQPGPESGKVEPGNPDQGCHDLIVAWPAPASGAVGGVRREAAAEAKVAQLLGLLAATDAALALQRAQALCLRGRLLQVGRWRGAVAAAAALQAAEAAVASELAALQRREAPPSGAAACRVGQLLARLAARQDELGRWRRHVGRLAAVLTVGAGGRELQRQRAHLERQLETVQRARAGIDAQLARPV
ncbi:hypothetical protein HT031_000165 [Scenedesmus sp. PABB004]|nr:hypothetical protein HT031_000165 [Scenedesmus sp. PABB004]